MAAGDLRVDGPPPAQSQLRLTSGVDREEPGAVATEAAAPGAAQPLLQVRNLTVDVGDVRLLDDVTFEIGRGDALGLVGESGSGKSLTCFAINRLLPAGVEQVAGHVIFDGDHIGDITSEALAALRGRRIAMIFQDPSACLNPLRTVGGFLRSLLKLHRGLRGASADAEAIRLLDAVGIPSPKERLRLYPHELSGGQNQRVMIAGALAGDPDLLIADEPTTALDVTTQAQVLDLLDTLRRERGMALLIVSHDFGVIAEAAARVAVMYAGQIVEKAEVRHLLEAPRHPYTAGLLRSIPPTDEDQALTPISGQPISPANRPDGCAFAPRCSQTSDLCRRNVPRLRPAGGSTIACHHPLVPT